MKGLEIPDDLAVIWGKIVDEDDSTTWVVAEYTSNGKALEVKSSGTVGLSEFKAALSAFRNAKGSLGELQKREAWTRHRCGG